MALETSNGTYVFFSYARRDKRFRDKLENHLCNLKYRGLITTWYDQEIRAGEEWTQQINIYLNKARIILLLISDDFMASEYCHGFEMKRALERYELGEAHVIPVLLRPVLFTDEPFAKLQMLPKNGKPVTKWSDRDSAFVEIACEIEKIVLIYKAKVSMERLYCSVVEPPTLLRRNRSGRIALTANLLLGLTISLLALVLIVMPFLASHSPASTPTETSSLPEVAILLCTILIIVIGAVVIVLRIIRARQDHIRQQQESEQQARIRREREQQETNQKLERLALEAAQALNEQRERESLTFREEQSAGIIQAAGEQELEVLQKRQYYEDTLKAYKNAITINPDDSAAFRGMGNVYYTLQCYAAAFDAFRQAVYLHPTAAAWAGIGNVLAHLQQHQQAVEAFEEALRLDNTVTLDYDVLVQSLMVLGRVQEAERYRERASELGYYDE
jgi:tetratricopeptide (TPR) repeat protein